MLRLVFLLLTGLALLCTALILAARLLAPADGPQIAYVQYTAVEGAINIVLADVEREQVYRLISQPTGESFAPPVWSADGRYLAYCHAGRINVMDLHTGETQRLPETGTAQFPSGVPCSSVTSPVWTRDPDAPPRLAYVYVDGDSSEIRVQVHDANARASDTYRIDGFTLRPAPAWTDDDAALYVYGDVLVHYGETTAAGTIGFMHLDLTTEQVTTYAFDRFCLDSPPSSWSPDGERFACAMAPLDDDGRSANLTLMDASSDPHFTPEALTTHGGTDGEARWSPDVQRLAFVSYRAGDSDIYLIDVASGAETAVTAAIGADFEPVWSPDSSSIVYVTGRHGSSEIYVYDDGTGVQRRFTDHPDADYAPSWSPDGNWIAFTSNRADHQHLYAMRVDGSGQRRVSPQPTELGDFFVRWRP